MSELEDEIIKTEDEIKDDEKKIELLKAGLWQKKKSLKALQEAQVIISGVKNKEEKEDETPPPSLKSTI